MISRTFRAALGGLVTTLTLASGAAGNEIPKPTVEPERVVDLAICLDTSGSMNGLIDAARQRLWAIVNDLALARPVPRLRVALLTFGNDGHSEESGWVKHETGLTEDLDLVSQQIFAQTTNGGTELVARVLLSAIEGLEWDARPDSLKLIFVAGNESADQDQQVGFRDVCKRAIESGIIVNSIYCGAEIDAEAALWREVATRAEGSFACIDQNQPTRAIPTPFDQELGTLNESLNDTYLPFGAEGRAGSSNQAAQDSNAAECSPGVLSQRAQAKASALYSCAWDLVDASRSKDFKLEDVKAEDLPVALRKMTLAERRAYLEKQASARALVQKKIQEVARKRDAFVIEERKQQAVDDEGSFENAVREAVRSQAEKKGFQFPKPPAPASNGKTKVE